MKYTEFQIGGKLRGFRFGLGFLGDILEHYHTNIQGLGQLMVDNPYSTTPAILYHAHRQHCLREGFPITFKLHDVQSWLDDIEDPLNNESIAHALGIMVDTIRKYLPKIEDEKEDEKKS